MKAKIGYLIPTRENIMRDQHGVQAFLDTAKHVEQAGFDSLWVGDSLFARPRHDPLTLLAALAAATSKIALGTAVLLPALRNPVILAQQIATIDQISNGRLIIGAGIAGDNPSIRAEFTAASVPFEKRVGRLVEGFSLMQALWQGQPVTWSGRWTLNDVTLAPMPAQAGGPPIWLAASVPAGIRRSARLYDGWFPIGPDLEGFASGMSILRSASDEFERTPPTAAIYLTICIDDDEARAEAMIDDYLTEYYGMPADIMRKFQACCGGPISKILAFMQAFEAAGADHLVLRLVGNHETALEKLAALKQ